MKNFLLKFNHGVEIGARLAYLGHYERTKDKEINHIAYEEYRHQLQLESILQWENDMPNPVIDAIFWVIGNTINWLCRYCPLWSLDLIARLMETFAIFSYKKLADKYPRHETELLWMAVAEDKHRRYFARSKK